VLRGDFFVMHVDRLKRTFLVAFTLSFLTSLIVYIVQSHSNAVTDSCSYLDPIVIDILAFCAGTFLIVESTVDIFKHKNSMVRCQLTRCVRMALGFSILTIHILQFIHK